MNLKNNFTFDSAAEKLRKNLPSNVSVILRSNLLDSKKKWFDIDKDMFVGVRVTFYGHAPIIDTYVPNILARSFSSGLISGIFHNKARNEFKKQIATIIISEFYE